MWILPNRASYNVINLGGRGEQMSIMAVNVTPVCSAPQEESNCETDA